ncbi:preprotein translocase subunit YajC [Legionella jordanis]|uniref:Sec translocon accessory complex subunit YajC n=1 Tax=Legionella jordanis TaxID=456 RepID=A0A0W0VEA6_9GAMM|nr:preprotein translocase subunit YajC [Legionella jordanis]KTD18462.1 SecYEG protein translocase auxillary subunit [Legionella jordanis]RMX05367.1 preprotein translocase subunit YajC [Legionella jordanis]VEH13190.1 SecYEG protein translocase auxillary subunit [Legionella jordanis]HAT8715034.1 preprotein translocase subunit YajC [Legionella jordanis]
MSFFISDALAAAPTTHAAQADGSFSLIMIVAIFVLFYFMLIRPQNKRAKEHREMLSKLKKGDEIVTSGGILAKVVNLDEQYIRVALSEGVEISIQRNAVSAILPKGTLKSL